MSPTVALRLERRVRRVKDKAKDFFSDLFERAYTHLIFGTTTNVEFFMCGILLLLGIWLILPIDTFNSAGGYQAMRQVAYWLLDVIDLDDKLIDLNAYIRPEEVWGMGLLLVAITWIYGLGMDSRRIRRFASASGVLIWTFIATCFIVSSPQFWSSVAYPYYAGVCIWLYIRAEH